MQDLTGMRFGRWTVIGLVEKTRKDVRWEAICDCGTKKIVSGNNLKRGQSKSCGCLNRERSVEYHTKHGGKRTRLYGIWNKMIRRCRDVNNKDYVNYGARGITICDEWHHFPAFREWAMSSGYSPDLTLDRKDNNKGYCPDNCHWATRTQQNRNKRNTVTLTIDGETRPLTEWAEINGICSATLQDRYKKGWDYRDLFIPPYAKPLHTKIRCQKH